MSGVRRDYRCAPCTRRAAARWCVTVVIPGRRRLGFVSRAGTAPRDIGRSVCSLTFWPRGCPACLTRSRHVSWRCNRPAAWSPLPTLSAGQRCHCLGRSAGSAAECKLSAPESPLLPISCQSCSRISANLAFSADCAGRYRHRFWLAFPRRLDSGLAVRAATCTTNTRCGLTILPGLGTVTYSAR
jgi:hypothetical protein